MCDSQYHLFVLAFVVMSILRGALFEQPVSNPEGRAFFDGIGERNGILLPSIMFIFFRGYVG